MNRTGSSVIQTFSGAYVDPLDLKVTDVRLEDIASSLAQQPRWSGHGAWPYSVAQHSLNVAAIVSDQPDADAAATLRALLHDASECYLVDIPRPVKHASAFGALYRVMEATVQATIFEAFGLPIEDEAAAQVIEYADSVMLATERRDLMTPDGVEWDNLPHPPLDRGLVEMPWRAARANYALLAENLIRDMVAHRRKAL